MWGATISVPRASDGGRRGGPGRGGQKGAGQVSDFNLIHLLHPWLVPSSGVAGLAD